MPDPSQLDRRSVLAGGLALGLAGVPRLGRGRANSPPDLLLVVGDDIGWPDLEGDTPMPAFEHLAERAVVYRNAFSQPTGSPTAYTLLSGRYPFRDGLAPPLGRWSFWASEPGPLPRAAIVPRRVALPRLLKRRGYHTALFGKWNLGAPDPSSPLRVRTPLEAGFHNWLAGVPSNVNEGGGNGYEDWVRIDDGVQKRETMHQSLALREAFRRWWRETPSPRFALVYLQAAHAPFHRTPDELLSTPFRSIEQPASERELGGFLHMKASRRWPDRKRYLGMVQSFTNLAAEFAALAGDATVLVTTDNGTPGRVTPVGRDQTRVKGTCYEGGIHVPLLALGPDLEPGERTTLAASVDVFATLLELAGLEPSEAGPIDSRSLVPSLGSSTAATRDAVYAESAAARVLRTADAKLRVTEEGDQVFRILRDRRERKPLAPADAPELHADLRARYDSLREA